MTLYIELIKYGLFIVILLVASFKIWVEVQKFVKKLKSKSESSLNFDWEVK